MTSTAVEPALSWREYAEKVKRHGLASYDTSAEGDHYAVVAILKNGERLRVGTMKTVPQGGITGLSYRAPKKKRSTAQWKQERKGR